MEVAEGVTAVATLASYSLIFLVYIGINNLIYIIPFKCFEGKTFYVNYF